MKWNIPSHTRTHSSTKEIKKYEWNRFRYIHFGMIHYLIELVFCAEHFTQKWLWSNSGSYSNEFNTKKIEYAMLQVNILQRIGSILESEWESSILPSLYIKSLKQFGEESKWKKERKRKYVQFTARIGTRYWGMCALEAINGWWISMEWLASQRITFR